MDDLDRYYELDNIISSLDLLIRETNDKDWREEFEALKNQAQKEYDEVHKRVSKDSNTVIKEQEREYREGSLN